MLILDLPEDVNNRLQLLAMRTGRTMAFYAMEALLEHLDDIEKECEVIQEASGEFEAEQRRGKDSG
ncbi:MAG: TraY domain-containing protein [Gammaproteobacteria bacterium]